MDRYRFCVQMVAVFTCVCALALIASDHILGAGACVAIGGLLAVNEVREREDGE